MRQFRCLQAHLPTVASQLATIIATVALSSCATLVYPPRGAAPGLVKHPAGGVVPADGAVKLMAEVCPSGFNITDQRQVAEGSFTSSWGESETKVEASATNRSTGRYGSATASGSSNTNASTFSSSAPNLWVYIEFRCGSRRSAAKKTSFRGSRKSEPPPRTYSPAAPTDATPVLGNLAPEAPPRTYFPAAPAKANPVIGSPELEPPPITYSAPPQAPRLEAQVVAVVEGRAVILQLHNKKRVFQSGSGCALEQGETVLFLADAVECPLSVVVGLKTGSTCNLTCETEPTKPHSSETSR